MSDSARRKRSLEEWQRLIEQQAGSGQSQTVFCAAHDLSKTTFQYWKRRLKAELSAAPSSSAAVFTPLLEVGGNALTEATGGWDIELDLGGDVCLRIRRSA